MKTQRNHVISTQRINRAVQLVRSKRVRVGVNETDRLHRMYIDSFSTEFFSLEDLTLVEIIENEARMLPFLNHAAKFHKGISNGLQ